MLFLGHIEKREVMENIVKTLKISGRKDRHNIRLTIITTLTHSAGMCAGNYDPAQTSALCSPLHLINFV